MPTTNYTVTSVVYTAASGTNVYNTNPTAVLTITPNEGYSIDANNFSWTNTDLNYINTVAFTQDGDNVLCTVTFDNPFTMPAANVDLGLCISGEATISELCCEIDLSVITPTVATGNNWNLDIQDNSPVPENIIFNVCGVEGQTITLFSRTYTCQNGYFFQSNETPDVSLIVADINQYTVTETNTTNSDGQITSTTIKVDYTFSDKCGGTSSYPNDTIKIQLWPGTQIQVPEIKITNYTLNTSDVGPNGAQRTMRVYGCVGATFTLESNNGAILSLAASDEEETSVSITPTQTIPSSGYIDVYIQIPASGSSAQYCFTLAGDLIDPFPQTNPICINQYNKTILTFNTTGANLTVTSTMLGEETLGSNTVTREYSANTSPANGSQSYYNKIKWTVKAAAGQTISLVSNPTPSWTNLTEYATTVTEAVQNSAIVPVASATGITTNMRMEGYNVTLDGNPPECTVSNINGTNITVDPIQAALPYDPTIDQGCEIKFGNRKGSILNLPTTATLSADQTTVTVEVNGIIERYGDTAQTFTLDLTSLITVGSTNTCCTWYLNDQAGSAARGGTLQFTACSGGTYTIKVPTKDQFYFCGLTTPAATYTTAGDGTVAITTAGSCNATQPCYTYTYVYTGKAPTTTITYIDCAGSEQTISVGTETSGNTFCGQRWDPVAADATNTTITRGSTSCS